MSIEKKGELFIDYVDKAMKGDANASKMVGVAVQAYMNQPRSIIKKQIQATGVSTDFAILTKDSFNVTLETDNFDMGWESAFRTVTLGRGQDSWEIYNVANGITFQKVEEGERIEVNKLTGTKLRGEVDYYGGALGWTDKMIRFRKVPAMVDMMAAFRNKFWANKADNHYAILAVAGALNLTAWQGALADGQVQRDVQTINECAFQLGDANKDKGYGDAANAPFIIYANPQDENRLEAAFRVTTASLAGAGPIANGSSASVTSRRIRRIYTYNSSITAGTPLMVWPGQKLQRADAMQPTTFKREKDNLTLNEVEAVWAIYGAIVADTDQVRTFTLG